MGKIEFVVEGSRAVAIERELRVLVSDALAEPLAPPPRENDELPPRVRGDMDAILIALSIPPAVLATWDLAERVRRLEKFKRLVAWATEQYQNLGVLISMKVEAKEKPLLVHETSPEQLRDASMVLHPMGQPAEPGTLGTERKSG